MTWPTAQHNSIPTDYCSQELLLDWVNDMAHLSIPDKHQTPVDLHRQI